MTLLPITPSHDGRACSRLGHYPGGLDVPPGAFEIRLPTLTAKADPRPSLFWVGGGHMKRLPWANMPEFFEDIIGVFCICIPPLILLS
jgi:hypothetical protein